ncbi:outer membrane insertion signal domain protein [Fusobacterium gonidiaformans 3-1-5R]|uniref:Outer membrane insertion signal domain protein n=1 Tax=Fusobacterium gonidiaformans 3-1-5R TaxID=469605 RepID=E5BFI7_9FUSO|nr:YadA-like family protein [Fusobacterium gonidiaformans]EFS20868.1 outer membrane insertion signal domain protein [Fusobacterium gonidiaformans 3-1-5R]
MKLEYIIKECLKGKVKVTQALLVAFFITGGISFSEVPKITKLGKTTMTSERNREGYVSLTFKNSGKPDQIFYVKKGTSWETLKDYLPEGKKSNYIFTGYSTEVNGKGKEITGEITEDLTLYGVYKKEGTSAKKYVSKGTLDSLEDVHSSDWEGKETTKFLKVKPFVKSDIPSTRKTKINMDEDAKYNNFISTNVVKDIITLRNTLDKDYSDNQDALTKLGNATSSRIDVEAWKRKLGVKESGNDILNVKYEKDTDEIILGKTTMTSEKNREGYVSLTFKNSGKPDQIFYVKKGTSWETLKDYLPEGKKSNYIFTGYSTEVNGTEIKERGEITEDLTLYGVYKKEGTSAKKYVSKGTLDSLEDVHSSDWEGKETTKFLKEKNPIKIKNLQPGEISANSKEAINGSQLHAVLKAMDDNIDIEAWKKKLNMGDKLNKNLSNFDNTSVNEEGKTKLITALNQGVSFETPTGALVKDSDVKAYVEGKIQNNKANMNGDNIEVANFTSVLNQGSNLEAPDGKLVTDSQVKDELDKYVKLDGTNVTDENRSGLIGKLSNGASLETPKNAVVTDTFLKNSLADKATKAELAEKADKTSVDNKANKNLDNIGNIADKAKTTLTEALGTGTVTENDTHLVTGKTVHEALKGKADANTLNQFVKKDGSNIDADVKKSLTDKLSEGASIASPTDTLVTDRMVKTELDKVNTSVDNKITENNKNYYNKKEVDDKLKNTLTSEDVDKKIDNKANKNLDNIGNIADKAKTTLTEALGTGTVTENDTHLVTGKTVHEALKGKADADLSNVSKDTIMEKVSKGNVTSTTLKIMNGENAALHAMTVDLKEGSIEKKHLGEGLSKTIDDLEAKDKEHDKAISTIAKQSIQNTKNINYIHNSVQENKQAIANNARRIDQVNQKINKTAALAQATSNLDFGQVRVGNIALGAGVGNYMSETGVAVGIAYRPNEAIFLSAKWTALAGEPRYNSYGASVSYQFSVK